MLDADSVSNITYKLQRCFSDSLKSIKKIINVCLKQIISCTTIRVVGWHEPFMGYNKKGYDHLLE